MAEPHIIHPTGVYFRETFQRIFRLKNSTLRREVREGRLRIARRAGRYYLLGEWILAWLRGGEVQRRAVEDDGGAAEARARPDGREEGGGR